MTRNRWAAFAALLLAVAAGAYAIAREGRDDGQQVRTTAERPTLALLTSLPIMFSETFGLDQRGSQALTRLEQRYRVVPIGVADAASLSGKQLLFMAHARAQPATALVDLDRWVREGGRVLLLADPRLEWPSERPLGDRLRPPPGFADTGLLAHWGLQLDAIDPPRPVTTGGGHDPLYFPSPGRLSTNSPACRLYGADVMASCRIGNGFVTVIADADFLNVEAIGAVEPPVGANLEAMMDELASLETRR